MAATPSAHGNRLFGVVYVLLGLVLVGLLAAPVVWTGQPAPSTPATGDWLISHILSDPEQLNPLTSNDATANSILGYIFESLLRRDPRTLELRPHLAVARPEISEDKLEYTSGCPFSGRPSPQRRGCLVQH
jgi:ABC-type transport system substrate-binding protein